MIITRAPFRVSLCGGGTDFPDFYRQHGGCVLSTAINKYMYISIHPYFEEEKTSLRYSNIEIVDNIENIQHKIFRAVLKEFKLTGVEISSTADIPSGTGLGSSSTFTVSLLNAIYAYTGKYVSKSFLAEKACEIEIEKNGAPIGKQDQYAAAFGGFNFITFLKNDEVIVEPLNIDKNRLRYLQDNLIMLYTGDVRSANNILKMQSENVKKGENTKNLIRMNDITMKMRNIIEDGNLEDVADILNENWYLKRSLSEGVTNLKIDDYYEKALSYGAKGGKLLGAGGGGFLLLWCEPEKQRRLVEELQLRPYPISFDYSGASVIFVGDKYWN